MLFFLASCFLSLWYGGSEDLNNKITFTNNFIFWQIRVPKSITAILAGSSLALSGLILQIIFRNPLAGPYVLGISSGASLMVAASILAGSSFSFMTNYFYGKGFIVLSAITGSFIVTILILFISKKISSNVILLLIGLMISQICGAIQTSLEYFSDSNSLKTFVVWGMGSLANTNLSDLTIYLPFYFIFMLSILFFIKPLNAMLLGENYATNLGINFYKNRFYLILISSALTGLTTAFCGPIAFIGIAIPILSRLIFKTSKQQVHLFSCILIGSSTLLISDAISNSIFNSISLPINMITTFIGAPLVIYLMFKTKHW